MCIWSVSESWDIVYEICALQIIVWYKCRNLTVQGDFCKWREGGGKGLLPCWQMGLKAPSGGGTQVQESLKSPEAVKFTVQLGANWRAESSPPSPYAQGAESSPPLQFPFGYAPGINHWSHWFKGCRMGCSDKVSLWYVALLINTRFRFFYFRISNC